MPVGAPTFGEALRMGVEVFHALKALLHERGLSTAVGDEGGFAPDLGTNEDAIKVILEAVERAGYTPGDRWRSRSTPPPASSTTPDGHYTLAGEGRDAVLGGASPATSSTSLGRYPIVSIEDGMAEDDWDGWRS